jgi:hypothetical protein
MADWVMRADRPLRMVDGMLRGSIHRVNPAPRWRPGGGASKLRRWKLP